MAQVTATIDLRIEAFLASRGFPPNLHDAIRYAALGGGKRLRPALAWYCSIACGGTGKDSICAGVAVELIHAFSLVHDDLPALDDDDLRRGKPTVHVRFDEATAILAGDAMMSMAFGLLAQTPGVNPQTTTALVRELAQATNHMIAGQALDTVGGDDDSGDALAQVRLIHEQKTGALIRAACRMGAIVAGAGAESLDAITRFGEAIGLMFQIVDDLIDVEQHESHTGKRTGKDEQANKLTYPGAVGVEAARREANQLCQEGIGALSPLGDRGRTLCDLTAYLACRTR